MWIYIKMEKPKMPRFAGDVRDYVIFRADFKHAVDSRYSKRDCISLIKGIVSPIFKIIIIIIKMF